MYIKAESVLCLAYGLKFVHNKEEKDNDKGTKKENKVERIN